MRTGVTSTLNHQNTTLNIFQAVGYLSHVAEQLLVYEFPNRIWTISTSWLNTLLYLHLTPINVIISHESHIDSLS